MGDRPTPRAKSTRGKLWKEEDDSGKGLLAPQVSNCSWLVQPKEEGSLLLPSCQLISQVGLRPILLCWPIF
ncbi:hypothetical protein KFK09_023312 [Dendrobium nobile]|uniref:Uncharacterized protein n=1 Tax=Dendrobium nobile TaxID=94219 RepID=A0A8T3AKD5_DENNO|nr:hypothetical protein KFK09_023312 [Dendrobium nobile]